MAAEYQKRNHGETDENKIWEDIKRKAGELQYGSITITLHDGKIVQVETSSKTRY